VIANTMLNELGLGRIELSASLPTRNATNQSRMQSGAISKTVCLIKNPLFHRVSIEKPFRISRSGYLSKHVEIRAFLRQDNFPAIFLPVISAQQERIRFFVVYE
jgi:hypothetical protein